MAHITNSETQVTGSRPEYQVNTDVMPTGAYGTEDAVLRSLACGASKHAEPANNTMPLVELDAGSQADYEAKISSTPADQEYAVEAVIKAPVTTSTPESQLAADAALAAILAKGGELTPQMYDKMLQDPRLAAALYQSDGELTPQMYDKMVQDDFMASEKTLRDLISRYFEKMHRLDRDGRTAHAVRLMKNASAGLAAVL